MEAYRYETISFPQQDRQRRVLFLDIDGVLQPDQFYSKHRFELSREERDQYPDKVADRTGIEHLRKMKWYDVAAVDLDWNRKAVENLRSILWNGGEDRVEIVLSSGWRETFSMEDMKALFALYHLDPFLTDMCPYVDLCSKRDGIRMYLKAHPDLTRYMVLDDQNFLADFPGHAICCDDPWMTDRIASKVRRIFRYGFWWEHLSPGREDLLKDPDIHDGIRNVVFLDVDGVLNTESKGPKVEESMVASLKQLLRGKNSRRMRAEVVLTSSWRYGLASWLRYGAKEEGYYYKDYKLLMDTLAAYEIDIADTVPDLASGPASRPYEIRTWLARHKDVEHFVILDDDVFWMWEELSRYFVRTTTGTGRSMVRGLTLRHVEEARKILMGELPEEASGKEEAPADR